MKPYYQNGGITVYCCDSKELIQNNLSFGAVISDPPWGTDTQCNARRFTRKNSPWWKNVDNSKVVAHQNIKGDMEEFDPRPWINVPSILWGANNFTKWLPHSNGWLIWDKRKKIEEIAEKGWPLGEAELAWTNVIGSTRVFRNLWAGLLRSTERGAFYHPTQKPVELMEWCINFIQDKDLVILDPFMGAGSLLVAAKNKGRRAIGCEIEESYCEVAVERLRQEVINFS